MVPRLKELRDKRGMKIIPGNAYSSRKAIWRTLINPVVWKQIFLLLSNADFSLSLQHFARIYIQKNYCCRFTKK